jgi:hypothetical protein
MTKMKAHIGVGKAVAAVGDDVAVSCELTFAFQK